MQNIIVDFKSETFHDTICCIVPVVLSNGMVVVSLKDIVVVSTKPF